MNLQKALPLLPPSLFLSYFLSLDVCLSTAYNPGFLSLVPTMFCQWVWTKKEGKKPPKTNQKQPIENWKPNLKTKVKKPLFFSLPTNLSFSPFLPLTFWSNVYSKWTTPLPGHPSNTAYQRLIIPWSPSFSFLFFKKVFFSQTHFWKPPIFSLVLSPSKHRNEALSVTIFCYSTPSLNPLKPNNQSHLETLSLLSSH